STEPSPGARERRERSGHKPPAGHARFPGWPERPQCADEIVPGVGTPAHGEDAAVRQSAARAEGGGDGLPDLADITRVDDAFAWIHGHRPAAATAREQLWPVSFSTSGSVDQMRCSTPASRTALTAAAPISSSRAP